MKKVGFLTCKSENYQVNTLEKSGRGGTLEKSGCRLNGRWTMSDMVKYRAAIWSFLKLTALYFAKSDIVHVLQILVHLVCGSFLMARKVVKMPNFEVGNVIYLSYSG